MRYAAYHEQHIYGMGLSEKDARFGAERSLKLIFDDKPEEADRIRAGIEVAPIANHLERMLEKDIGTPFKLSDGKLIYDDEYVESQPDDEDDDDEVIEL